MFITTLAGAWQVAGAYGAAANNNSLDMARLLIEHGAEVDARGEGRESPIHYAADNNSLDVARLLIEHGANTDGIDLSWMEDEEV